MSIDTLANWVAVGYDAQIIAEVNLPKDSIMLHTPLQLSVFLFLSVLSSCAFAQEWTRFRGPNGTGYSDTKTIPVEFSEADFNWKAELPGIGHSCPVVWGEKLFLLSADPTDATRYVLCVNSRTGIIEWQKTFPSETHQLHARSSYASCTPTVDKDRVYVAWSEPQQITFKAFTHEGQEVWSKDLGRWQSQHGWGASPIRYKDLVIIHNSQQANGLKEGEEPGDSFMMAFHAATGEEVWQTPLVSVNVCYSVPFIYSPPNGGPDELVCVSTGNGMFSLNPLTGKQNWGLNDGLFKMRTVASPITAAGLIFGSTGSGAYSGNYIVAVKPGKNPELAYEIKNSGKFKAPYVPCYLAYGDLIFMIYDRGFISCLDAVTGEIHFTERTQANFSASPVLIDDKIYAVDEEGVVWVWAADKKYKLLAKNELGEASRSTPAVSGGHLFIRTYSHLISIGAGS